MRLQARCAHELAQEIPTQKENGVATEKETPLPLPEDQHHQLNLNGGGELVEEGLTSTKSIT